MPNVDDYWKFVTDVYPDAVFDFWYENGELVFYPTQDAENPYLCFKRNDQFYIVYEF